MDNNYTVITKGVLKPVNDATREDRARAVQLVETLGQSSRVVTLVNSARSLPALDSYRGIGVNLVAEHGTVVLPADQSWQKDFDVEGTDNIRYRIKQIADRHRTSGPIKGLTSFNKSNQITTLMFLLSWCFQLVQG
jgi:hypothetical protein